MTRALRSPRRAAAALVLFLLAVLSGPGPVLGQTEADEPVAPPPASTILTQDGWWNRAQGPQEGEPESPIRPTIGGVVPTPSTVPANGLGVGAVLGEPDKVAAVGLLIEGPADVFVDRLALHLKEVTTSGASANTEAAKILACPITSFWASAKNGDFVSRPACDDSQSVVGERAADGTWTFDLTLMATTWLDPASGVGQNGVLLKEAVDAPVSFQVSFGDLSTGTITSEIQVTDFGAPAEFTFDESFAGTETEDSSTFADDSGSTFDTTDTGSGLTDAGTTFDASTGGAAAPTGTAVAPPAAAPAAAGGSGTALPIASTPNLFGNLPVAALLFLALLVLGAALFLGVVLGPLASPVAAPGGARSTRAGGVSRALAAREAAAASSTTSPKGMS